MIRSIKRVGLLLTVLGCGALNAASSEFRSPDRLYRGMMHYPLCSVQNAWWFDAMPEGREESLWNVYSWKHGYARSASESFFTPCASSCENKVTSKKVSLSTLWFGKEEFRGEEAFAGGFIDTAMLNAVGLDNIFLGFSRITPRFDYNEYGVVAGMSAERTLGSENQWHVGARASIPFKVIEIEQDQNCKLAEDLDDVYRLKRITDTPAANTNNTDFVARLDFLSTLVIPNDPAASTLFVFQDTTVNPIQVRVGNNPVSGLTSTVAQVFLIGNNIGNNNKCCIPDADGFPAYPFRKDRATVVAAQLPANGASSNGAITFFGSGVNYGDNLFKDHNAMSKLFVVPAGTVTPVSALDAGGANQLEQIFEKRIIPELVSLGDKTGADFFKRKCIDLCAAERITGAGDLDTEIFGGYRCQNWFLDGLVGVKFPTGKKSDDVNRVFHKSTGNNGHFEAHIGLEGAWNPCRYFGLKADARFHHAFKRIEHRAAPFTGATIRNIGSAIDAEVSWNYFTGHVDFTLFHPHNPEMGCVFGYELFAKRKDNVCLKCDSVTDLLGRTQTSFDATILEKNTNSLTHKLGGELFHRWNYFELYAGASQIVAGRNAMHETSMYIGASVYF